MNRPLLALGLWVFVGGACSAADPDPDLDSDSDSDSDTDPDAGSTASTRGSFDATGAPTSGSPGDSSGSSGTEGPEFDDGFDDSPVSGQCRPSTNADPFADCIESFSPGGDASFGHDLLPQVVLGPPMAGAGGAGSTDVASLGCGGRMTLYFDEPAIEDGPGVDFIVFENPFPTGDETFAEPARVLVSDDGVDWRAFDCALTADAAWPPTGCAGIRTVFANPSNGWATDPDRAGGDGFDLADVGLEHARYVRLVDVSRAYNGNSTWCSGAPAGFDLDAIGAIPR